jgi:putative transposase
MRRTISLRLDANGEQDAILAATLAASRACFNAVAAHGWENNEKNGVELHRATYHTLRDQHPTLPSQLVISARMKATEALRSAFVLRRNGKKVSAPHAVRGSVRYDARSHRMEPDAGMVGLSTTAGRIKFPFAAHDHAAKWLERATGFDSADLIRRPSGWWLNVVVTIDVPDIAPSGKVVGVDLGINRPAVTSEAIFLGKRRWKETDQRYFRLNRGLQSKGTKSAKRHLRKLRTRRTRFRKDCDHVLSKRVVESVAPGSVIVVENLADIRIRTKQRGRKQRRRHHSWSFAQLRTFITYKAEDHGCPVFAIDPRNTSRTCPKCGHIHKRNRPQQSIFRCLDCGYELNADLVAARNIAAKYHAEAGKSGLGGHPVNMPIVGEIEPPGTPPTHKPSPSGDGS